MLKKIMSKIREKLRRFLLDDQDKGFTSSNITVIETSINHNMNYVESDSIYETPEKDITEIYSIWDFLELRMNTQAYYLTKVIGFEEWLTMEEIKRRILELFGVNFEHEKSLYPYLKTLVDTGLLENSNHGGKRKWRKRDLIIKLTKKKEKALEALQTI